MPPEITSANSRVWGHALQKASQKSCANLPALNLGKSGLEKPQEALERGQKEGSGIPGRALLSVTRGGHVSHAFSLLMGLGRGRWDSEGASAQHSLCHPGRAAGASASSSSWWGGRLEAPRVCPRSPAGWGSL